MVDQAKTLRCWWCLTKAPLFHVAECYQGAWYPRCVCKSCFDYIKDVCISPVKTFDTQEERDLWLVKQRL